MGLEVKNGIFIKIVLIFCQTNFPFPAECFYQQFFYVTTDTEPFYTHWYRKPGDSFDPCGHLDIADDYDTETTCLICLEQENGQLWIQCPLCN